jgi:hypothetical protein
VVELRAVGLPEYLEVGRINKIAYYDAFDLVALRVILTGVAHLISVQLGVAGRRVHEDGTTDIGID